MIKLARSIGLILLAILPGCTQILAERAVKAPNLQNHRVFLPPTPPELIESFKSAKQIQIPVGPPDASLSVWVSQANLARRIEVDVSIRHDKTDFRMVRTPVTMPSTLPRTFGTIFLLHGITDNQELGPYLLYKEILVTTGYRVVQVDLRGHGRSTGKWITFGVVESRDLVQVLDELEKQGEIVGPVGVLGASYGAGVAIQWAAIDPRVKAVVALEPFANYHDAAHDAAPVVLGNMRWMFSDKEIDKAIELSGKMAGFDPAQASPINAIAKTKAPVLIFHSRSDELVSYQQSERLHAAAPDHSKLVLFENQSHFWMWLNSLNEISNQSVAWFRQHLSK